ncbi:MAG: PorT family protein [Armatimonadetes bacterium]|nr:PorT family protein [Armatimonadota bacterium]
MPAPLTPSLPPRQQPQPDSIAQRPAIVAVMPDKEDKGGRKNFRQWLLVVGGLVGLLLAGGGGAQSQVMVGVRGGINIANQSFDPPFFTGVRHGLLIGGHIQAPLDSTLSVVFQPQYVQKGVVIEGAAGALVTAEFNYLEFPLMLSARYRVRPLMVFAVAGINPGVLMSAASVKRYADSTVTIEAGAQTNTLDIAIDVGVGVGYQVTNQTTITGDIRYCFGLTDITVERGSSSTNSSRDLRIIAGALFRLGK